MIHVLLVGLGSIGLDLVYSAVAHEILEVETLLESIQNIGYLIQLAASFLEFTLRDVQEGVVDFLEHFSDHEDAYSRGDHEYDHHTDDDEQTQEHKINEVLICGVHVLV